MYEYKGYTVVINGTGGAGATVYGPNGFEAAFATEKEAEEYIDALVENK